AISNALKKGGVTFDFIGFDACLMATLENALMLDEYADYLIGSEETEPGIGWYYTNWLTALSSDPSMPTIEIGKRISDDFVAACARECPGQSATLSVIDLAELSATVPDTLKSFSQNLSTLISDNQYQQISSARTASREFARSTKIDQIDLVDFAKRVGTKESRALADALLGAVKYNRCSSGMTSAYGLSIYFPCRKVSTVDQAVRTYQAIGMDASYSKCIQEFAGLEVSGQAATGGTASPLPYLLGTLGGGASSSGGDVTELIGGVLGSFLGGNYGSVSGLTGGNVDFLFGRSLSEEETAAYIAENYFDASALVWQKNYGGDYVISLEEDQWALVEELDLNVFYDDGEGYLDLGLDNVFEFDDNYDLLAPTDRSWLAVNGQIVAYYHDSTYGSGDDAVYTGHVPVLLNGERAELLVTFDAANPYGAITGARYVYAGGETDTVAKSTAALTDGDVLDFICDYYTYDGVYENTYMIGEPLTVSGDLTLTNVAITDGALRTTYRFTDLYQQHYWTEPLIG
ncbi:MAG: peptidase C11, partial [Oscillibacter sp.]|nr:peptidase C11 [Oscillibacter sp.]